MKNWRPLALLTMLYAPVLAAQAPANWTEQFPQTGPAQHSAGTMAYDSARSQVVWFGQGAGTWVWDGSRWTQKSPQNTPPFGGPMAYDSMHSQIVMYAESGTFVWDGSDWTQLFPQNRPYGLSNQALAYDPVRGQVVLFGGMAGNGTPSNETWVWDGVDWTQLFPQTSPSPRFNDAMAFDSAHGQVVMFGGEDINENALGDTWVWDGSNWTQKSLNAGPPVRAEQAMSYDSVHGQVIMFGGQQAHGTFAGQPVGDTWVWDGSSWTQEHPQASPSARFGASMAYDPIHDESVLWGGEQSGILFFADTWIWNDGPIPATPPPPPPPATVGPSVTGVVSASAFGGFSSVAPGSWVEIYGSNLAPGARSWAVGDFTGNNAPTSLDGVSVSIGGHDAFVDYISTTQVNAQLPSDIPTGGMLQLTVTNGTTTSAPINLNVNPTEPGLLAPASFKIGANQYVVAQFSDGTYVLPIGAIAGVNSRPAKPGEVIVIYGIGFGDVTPATPAGEIVNGETKLALPFEILFGETAAPLPYFGLAPNFVGLYQFNVTVPSVADSDLVPLTFHLGGAPGTQTLYTAVQQ